MKQKRERLEIIHDMLRVIRDSGNHSKPTRLLYKSNLSHKMMKEYLDYLIENRFVVESEEKGSKTYSLTERGFEYLQKYSTVLEFMDTFGL